MAEEDEIDVLGEFSFNSCLAQNDQGIPSCSGREDTVHPEWLLDSPSNNWYDTKGYSIPPTLLVASQGDLHTSWSQSERNLLTREMYKYGRDIKKISQKLTTKSEAEIQALIEAEHGVNLEIPSLGLGYDEASLEDEIPAIQEEIVTDEDSPMGISKILNMVTTGQPTFSTLPINKTRRVFTKKITKNKRSILKPDVLLNVPNIDSSEIIYEDDLTLGSVECIGAPELDCEELLSKNIYKNQMKADNGKKPKVAKKIGNHRRRNTNDKLDRIKDSFNNRQRKNSSKSNESVRSPKLHIVLGSGQALPVSEGEQVIKIEKKEDLDAESDVEVDIDSDQEKGSAGHLPDSTTEPKPKIEDSSLHMRKFEPMPKRGKKFNLEGSGGCTIMHTEAGDLYEISAEPRKDKPQKKSPIALIPCKQYTDENPAPFSVRLYMSALISMEVQAHSSRSEVMGLIGGERDQRVLRVQHYWPAAAAATYTHCDMCPVSQAAASEKLQSLGCSIVGWHHSHPTFPASPSRQDLRTQLALQQTLHPSVALITSQHWTAPRSTQTYKCVRVEIDSNAEEIGYDLKVELHQDLTPDNVPAFLDTLREMLHYYGPHNSLPIDVATDLCPQTGITYLEKCLSTVRHHLHCAGFLEDPLVPRLIAGLRDVFR